MRPGETASFTLTLTNPTATAVTYVLSAQGVTESRVNLPSSITVAAKGTTSIPFTITTGAYDPPSELGFTITAAANNGASGSVGGTLVLEGEPLVPVADPEAHGVVVQILPSSAVAGQGTAANYVVRVINTGSAAETFTLSTTLPPGVSGALGQSTVEIQPGASNFRDTPLRLTPRPGSSPGATTFSVTAAAGSVSSTASGPLTVVANGVAVALSPPQNTPGGGYQLAVTNTGSVMDTFNLALAGPGGLVAKLAANQVTLAPGASRTVAITTEGVNFALPGDLDLTALAVSQTNNAVIGAAMSTIQVPTTQGLTAQFSSPAQRLVAPGNATFTLLVNNTGNTEDAYTVFIAGTTGPVTASLIDQGGLPTQSIALFRLPGLSSGAFLLQTNLAASGQGTVTIAVKSMTNGSIVAFATATVDTAPVAVTPPPPLVVDGPSVTEILRHGIHWQPTTLVLYFNQSLRPAAAQKVNNYVIIDRQGHRVPIRRAVYDPTTQTVTLHPVRRLNFHYGYKLTVLGAGVGGVSNMQGRLLDGTSTGAPGSNYHAIVNRKNLVWPKSIPRLGNRLSASTVHRPIAQPGHPTGHVKVVPDFKLAHPKDRRQS